MLLIKGIILKGIILCLLRKIVSISYYLKFVNVMKKNISQLLLLFVMAISSWQDISAQVSLMPGYINGDNVNLRSDHSTQSKAITMLKRGQSIYILTSFRPEGNDNEAILRVNSDFYDTDYGMKLFSLPKGKAVKINGRSGEMYNISFKNDMTGKTGYAKIDPSRLEFIGGDTWYFVEVNQLRGWVYGKYVSYY